MAAPTFKFATDTNPGSSAQYGAPDLAYALHVVDGSHATDRIPIAAVQNTAVSLSDADQVITGAKQFSNNTLKIISPTTNKTYIFVSNDITVNRNITIPLLTADDTLVLANFVQTLTNKTINGSQNTLSSIASGSIVPVLQSKLLDSSCTLVDATDNTKVIAYALSGMTTAKTLTFSSSQSTSQTLTIPNITGADTLSTLSLAQTFLATKTFTTGLLKAADIIGTNGLKVVDFSDVASALNWVSFTAAATGNPSLISAAGETNSSIKIVPKGTGEAFGFTESMAFPIGAESGNKVAGTYNTYYMARAGKIVWAEQCCTVAPTTAALTLDVKLNGTTIFSTKPTIAASANTGSNGVLTTNPTVLAKGDKLEFLVSTNDTGLTSAGTKLTLGIYRTS